MAHELKIEQMPDLMKSEVNENKALREGLFIWLYSANIL